MSLSQEIKQPSIRLSPYNSLHFEWCGNSPLSDQLAVIEKFFTEDWRKGWFFLAANKVQDIPDPSIHFWQQIAADCLTKLCHLPAEIFRDGGLSCRRHGAWENHTSFSPVAAHQK